MKTPPKTSAFGISLPGFFISEAKVVTTSKPRKLKIMTEMLESPVTSRLGMKLSGVNALAEPRVTAT